MVYIKRNIWLAFYFTLFLWSIVSAVAAYYVYQEVYDDIVAEQTNVTTITANSLSSSFAQYESIVDIVGDELIRENVLSQRFVHHDALNAVVGLDDSILIASLHGVTGNVYATSILEQQDQTDLIKALTDEQVKRVIATDGPVLGRTRYSDSSQGLIIPFRKAIRDRQGNALFILTLGVSLEEGFDYFIENMQQANFVNSFLYRERDRFFQLAPIENLYNPDIYRYQISQADIDRSVRLLEQHYGASYQQIKAAGGVFVNELNHDSRESLAASIFLPEYGLWLTTETKTDEIEHFFLRQVTTIIALYLLAAVVIYLMFRNIARSEQEKHRQLTFRANHDYLTGLYNRFYLDNYLSSLPSEQSLSLIRVDLDNFRAINKLYGNAGGDVILIEVAKRIGKVAASEEIVIRSDGDEFMLLSKETDWATLATVCQTIQHEIAVPYRYKEIDIALTCSIGVAMTSSELQSYATLIRNSDLAMSIAKREYNKVELYQESLLSEFEWDNLLELELKQAIRRKELSMVYQPQLDHLGEVKGVEALLRWNNDKLGFVSPDKFIPIAEKCGLMTQIGAFVIEQSLLDIRAINEQYQCSLELSINISVKQLRDEHFVFLIEQAMRRHQFDPHKLILEATESVFIDDIDQIMSTMAQIKRLGIRLSLDDFGTGYSSLSLLKTLPIDEIKIDKSFVFDMATDQGCYSMVESIILLAQKLKMTSVAEGVETQEVCDLLAGLGVDYYQGYFYSKPLDVNSLSSYITNRA